MPDDTVVLSPTTHAEVEKLTTLPALPLKASPQPKGGKPLHEHSLTWLEERCSSARGETALWVAVITQAMMDALSRCQKAESRYQKHEATCWLTSNSKDFVDVCLRASMDPDYVRRKAKKALAAPTPWRAEAGKGKRYMERKHYRAQIRERTKENNSLSADVLYLQRTIIRP